MKWVTLKDSKNYNHCQEYLRRKLIKIFQCECYMHCDVQGVVARTTKLILHVNREGLYLILFSVSF